MLRCGICCAAGKETINTLYGTRVAVLAGDFLFAQSSWLIANLENMEVRLHMVCGLKFLSGRTVSSWSWAHSQQLEQLGIAICTACAHCKGLFFCVV